MTARRTFFMVTALLLVLLCGSLAAAPMTALSVERDTLRLGDNLEYLIDTGHSLTVEDVVRMDAMHFVRPDSPDPSFGFLTDPIWVRFDLKNDSPRPLGRLIVLESAMILNATLYRIGELGVFDTQRQGWLAEGRGVEHATLTPSFQLGLGPGEHARYALYIQSDGPIYLSLNIVDPVAFTEWDNWVRFVYSFYLILGFGFAIFHLSVYYFNRRLAYLFIGPFSISFALTFYIGSGTAAHQLPTSLVPYFHEIFPMTISAIQFSGLLFLRQFLQSNKAFPRIDRFLRGLVGVQALLMGLALFLPGPALLLSWLSVPISLLVQLSLPVAALKNGQRSALLFLLGFGIFAAMIVISIVISSGYVRPAPILLMVSGSGFIVIALMASIALAAEGRKRERQFLGRIRELNWKLAKTEERERRQIAEDLHDGVCQLLTGAKFQFSYLKSMEGDATRQKQFKDGLEAISQAIVQARQAMSDLSPPVLHNLGLFAALEDTATRLNRQFNIATTLTFTDEHKLADRVQPALIYRVIQELATNIVKHAKASQARIALDYSPQWLKLRIHDDGEGFNPKRIEQAVTSASGLGLLTIQNKVKQLGGTFEIYSQAGKGTRIEIGLPILPGDDLKV